MDPSRHLPDRGAPRGSADRTLRAIRLLVRRSRLVGALALLALAAGAAALAWQLAAADADAFLLARRRALRDRLPPALAAVGAAEAAALDACARAGSDAAAWRRLPEEHALVAFGFRLAGDLVDWPLPAARTTAVDTVAWRTPLEDPGVRRWLQRAAAHRQAGRHDAALAALQSALDAGPPPALRAEVAMQRSAVLSEAGRSDEAMAAARDVVALADAEPALVPAALAALLRIGDLAAAADRPDDAADGWFELLDRALAADLALTADGTRDALVDDAAARLAAARLDPARADRRVALVAALDHRAQDLGERRRLASVWLPLLRAAPAGDAARRVVAPDGALVVHRATADARVGVRADPGAWTSRLLLGLAGAGGGAPGGGAARRTPVPVD